MTSNGRVSTYNKAAIASWEKNNIQTDGPPTDTLNHVPVNELAAVLAVHVFPALEVVAILPLAPTITPAKKQKENRESACSW